LELSKELVKINKKTWVFQELNEKKDQKVPGPQ